MKVHFIGIGGIGMSALARMFLAEGARVSGSDQAASAITNTLSTLGVDFTLGQKAENIQADLDLVVYTVALAADNPELARARELGLPLLTYPQLLGQISANKYTIAVAGTHGKTTTTAMLAEIMIAAKLAPTVVVGSLLKSGTNFVSGTSQYLLTEACEFKRSFLNLQSKILVITNIDNDHLDYYKDLADIQSAFAELVGKLPSDGYLVCDINDERLEPVLLNARCQTIDYRSVTTEALKLKVPGAHNLKNAQAALAVAQVLKIESAGALEALNNFRGTWRRFEYRGELSSGAKLYDDYAHHPAEISATIAAAREVSRGGRLLVIFQPHLYSRTKLLFDDFAVALASADEVWLLPIYGAREPFDASVDSATLAAAITERGTKATALDDFATMKGFLVTEPHDLVITMGAGDISQLPAFLL